MMYVRSAGQLYPWQPRRPGMPVSNLAPTSPLPGMTPSIPSMPTTQTVDQPPLNPVLTPTPGPVGSMVQTPLAPVTGTTTPPQISTPPGTATALPGPGLGWAVPYNPPLSPTAPVAEHRPIWPWILGGVALLILLYAISRKKN